MTADPSIDRGRRRWWVACVAAGVAAVALLAVAATRDHPTDGLGPANPAGSAVTATGSDPVTVDVAATQAVLDALADNGVLAELEAESRAVGLLATDDPAGRWLLPIVHLVRCDRQACSAVADWARTNGLDASEVIELAEHGGVPWYRVELRERLVPDADTIVDRAGAVMVGVEGLGGVDYQEWQADARSSQGAG